MQSKAMAVPIFANDAESSLSQAMGEVLRNAAARCVLPRFCRLGSGDVEEKSPGDLVTVADREAETFIAAGLADLRPRARVVGEEACALNPAILNNLGCGEVWIIDPIDGTGNFASGRAPFAMMAALMIDGTIIASAILDPLTDRLMLAEKGQGASVNGEPMRRGNRVSTTDQLSGIISHFERPLAMEARVTALLQDGKELVSTKRCAGHEYPMIAAGERHFALYWRTLVWDHAPGILLLEEAGGKAAHLDGEPYRAGCQSKPLLLAYDEAIWEEIALTMTNVF